ncbi:MAG: lysylphosphatidylglycerol synthase transmembrane domain-containing protein [Halieaceae bacterium]|nr:lysylphosphatidylglycerol synthase transmembrane domain-containing protein [Halieaceae bacterium]
MRRGLFRSLQLAVTVASLAALWQIVDGETALRQLAAAQPVWIAGALAALTLQTLLSALRWRLTAARLGIPLERGVALREYYLSQIVNQLLPGGVLGDAGRAYRVRSEAGLLVSGQAVLFERFAGQLALFAVFALGVIGTQLVPGGFEGPRWLLPLVLLVALGALLVFRALVHRPTRREEGPMRRFVRAFVHAVAAREVRPQQFALSLGTALCNIGAFACCAIAVSAPLSMPAALVLVPLVLFSMVIPLSVSGWGLREGAAAAMLPLAGGTAAAGLAASVAFGLVMLLAALPGLLALVFAAAPDPLES